MIHWDWILTYVVGVAIEIGVVLVAGAVIFFGWIWLTSNSSKRKQ